jgi:hypothetical protein
MSVTFSSDFLESAYNTDEGNWLKAMALVSNDNGTLKGARVDFHDRDYLIDLDLYNHLNTHFDTKEKALAFINGESVPACYRVCGCPDNFDSIDAVENALKPDFPDVERVFFYDGKEFKMAFVEDHKIIGLDLDAWWKSVKETRAEVHRLCTEWHKFQASVSEDVGGLHENDPIWDQDPPFVWPQEPDMSQFPIPLSQWVAAAA